MRNSGQFQPGASRIYVKVCTKCGETFDSKTANRRKCERCCACEWCGAALRYSHQRFCDNSCAGKWKVANSESVRSALASGQDHPNRAEGIRRYRAGRERPDLRRENNPNWKGGTYGTIRHTEMGRIEYKTWRLAVYKRDGFACVMCRASDGRLQAHHIRPWRNHPDRWFDVDNGVTLCGPCHRAIGTDEELFADRFEEHARRDAPVELTEDERERFAQLIADCATCGAQLRRPRHHRKRKLHFCNVNCRKTFERAIGGNWRGFAAGRVMHPFADRQRPASGSGPSPAFSDQ